jgi:altronate hydrolase
LKGLIEINKLERKPATLDKLCIGVNVVGVMDLVVFLQTRSRICFRPGCCIRGKILLAEFPELWVLNKT